jgi:hypothetical protein
MSDRERFPNPRGSSGRNRQLDPNVHSPDNDNGRHGGIARDTVDPSHPRFGFATKAARKTFARLDLDSYVDSGDSDPHSGGQISFSIAGNAAPTLLYR